MSKIIRYIISDIIRNKTMMIYTFFLLILTLSVFSLEDHATKGLLSMLNLVLIIVPLMSMMFSAIYWYNSSEFIELLVSQPIQRKRIWISFFIALSISLCIAYGLGTGLMVLIISPTWPALVITIMGLMLSIIFCALASWLAVLIRDKAKGIGVTLIVWLFFSVLYDGLILFALFQLSDYPIEKPMVFITFFNPIDIARIMVLMQMDVAAMMGFTGAIFKDFFGTATGLVVSGIVLSIWVIIPVLVASKKFIKKDL